jgi:hypothetical protein
MHEFPFAVGYEILVVLLRGNGVNKLPECLR